MVYDKIVHKKKNYTIIRSHSIFFRINLGLCNPVISSVKSKRAIIFKRLYKKYKFDHDKDNEDIVKLGFKKIFMYLEEKNILGNTILSYDWNKVTCQECLKKRKMYINPREKKEELKQLGVIA